MIELGSRVRHQPAPPHAVWDALTDPHRDPNRPWLDLLPDEVAPRVVEAVRPSLVVWSSLWPDRPDDLVRFELTPLPGTQGSALRWTLTTPGPAPSTSKLGHLRHRLNFLVNARLRYTFGN